MIFPFRKLFFIKLLKQNSYLIIDFGEQSSVVQEVGVHLAHIPWLSSIYRFCVFMVFLLELRNEAEMRRAVVYPCL